MRKILQVSVMLSDCITWHWTASSFPVSHLHPLSRRLLNDRGKMGGVFYIVLTNLVLITVAAHSKAWTVFARSNTGIVGSNPTQNMGVSLRLFCVVVLCRYRPCSGLIPHPRGPTDCPRIMRMKWNKAFHGCPILRSGSNRRERERERER
jgi:hypothetical protein